MGQFLQFKFVPRPPYTLPIHTNRFTAPFSCCLVLISWKEIALAEFILLARIRIFKFANFWPIFENRPNFFFSISQIFVVGVSVFTVHAECLCILSRFCCIRSIHAWNEIRKVFKEKLKKIGGHCGAIRMDSLFDLLSSPPLSTLSCVDLSTNRL